MFNYLNVGKLVLYVIKRFFVCFIFSVVFSAVFFLFFVFIYIYIYLFNNRNFQISSSFSLAVSVAESSSSESRFIITGSGISSLAMSLAQ